jgi:hypothetical protein
LLVQIKILLDLAKSGNAAVVQLTHDAGCIYAESRGARALQFNEPASASGQLLMSFGLRFESVFVDGGRRKHLI